MGAIKEVDIIAWLSKNREDGVSAGCLKYVLPLEKARQKVLQLLDKVATGELECFAVSPREEGACSEEG